MLLYLYLGQKYTHSGQSTHFKGWGFEILKNCKRVGIHIFPLKRVEANYKGWGSSDFQVVHLYLQNKIEKTGISSG